MCRPSLTLGFAVSFSFRKKTFQTPKTCAIHSLARMHATHTDKTNTLLTPHRHTHCSTHLSKKSKSATEADAAATSSNNESEDADVAVLRANQAAQRAEALEYNLTTGSDGAAEGASVALLAHPTSV
jgi:hypothetical protein